MEHKEIELATIEHLITFLRKNHTKLEDEDDRKTFHDIIGYLETAKVMATDNKRRTCLYDAATKYANQLAFRLFIEDNLDDDLTQIFRSFETVKQVSAYAAAYSKEDKERADEITRMQQEYMDEREPFEVFRAVIGGMSEEEAIQKQEAFKQRQEAAIHNAEANGQI